MPSFDRRKTRIYLILAIIASVVTIVISTILFALRKRIELLVKLFEESGKAIGDMPFLLIQPILVRLYILYYFNTLFRNVSVSSSVIFPDVVMCCHDFRPGILQLHSPG